MISKSLAGDNTQQGRRDFFFGIPTAARELFSEKFTEQKSNYIHNNPVEAGIVEKAEDYLYSSAKDYYYGKQCGLLELDFLC